MDELTGWEVLDRFLSTGTQESDCAEAFELLDTWAELVLLGADPARHLPRVAAHLRACQGCFEDLTGLLQVMTQLQGHAAP